MNYHLKCGSKSYEVTPEVQETLEAVMYYCFSENLDSQKLVAVEKDKIEKGDKSAYSDEEIRELKYEIEQEQQKIGELMKEMEKQDVPSWVGNAAMCWGEKTDLREHYLKEFFEESDYADKEKTAENISR